MTESHVKKSRPDGAGAIQNEDWNDDIISLHQHQEAVGAAAADLTPSRVESAVLEEAAAASSLDNYLHNYPSVSDFVLSIPSRKDEMPSDNEHNNEDGSFNESILSDISEMTYRAELMKEAIQIEYDKFRQQHADTEATPKEIATMFACTMSCPDIQASVNSFVNNESAKMKAEKRRSDLGEVAEEDDSISISDLSIRMRVDELYVEFGVRPSRSPHKLPDEEDTARVRPSNEQDVVPDDHLDSVIQLKLQLAQKQAAYDELSSKYVAMILQNQKSEQQKLLDENLSLKRENERLRALLDQADMTSAAPNLIKASSLRSLSFTRKDSNASPISPLDLSFSSMIQGWRNRAA